MQRLVTTVGAFAVAVALTLATAAAGETGSITELRVPTANSQPLSIVTGPDDNLWVTEFLGNTIVRLTPGGDMTEFPIPTANSGPDEIDVGPDGNLWFAEVVGNRIGRITPQGVIAEFLVPTPNSRPTVIAPGPDGNLWFSERGTAASPGNKLGRITPSGAITEFVLPNPGSRPLGVTGGPDGNVWFTEQAGNRIGRIDAATGAIAEFALPNAGSAPWEITAGPDDNLWFTEFLGNRIGRITPDGEITEFPLPGPGRGPNTIRRGLDPNAAKDCALQRRNLGEAAFAARYGTFGNCVVQLATTQTLWFSESLAGAIAQITTDGVVFEHAIPTSAAAPIGVAEGPDGAVWFAENAANKIGRLDVQSVRQPAGPGARATVATLVAAATHGLTSASATSTPVRVTFDTHLVNPARFTFAGTTGGDAPGTIVSELVSIDNVSPTVYHVTFDWFVTAGARSFVARTSGIWNLSRGLVTMNGSVTSGYLCGAEVHEQGELVDPDTLEFQGVIQLMPATAQGREMECGFSLDEKGARR